MLPYKITIYDSHFTAASESEKVPLMTMDGELYEQVKSKRSVNEANIRSSIIVCYYRSVN